MASFRDTSRAPAVAALAAALDTPAEAVAAALQALAREHALVLRPASDAIWMAHPFSGVETDFLVSIEGRQWYANCAWDGLAILALLGDGVLETHCPVSRAPLRFVASKGTVRGAGVIHFLVPARRFWDDIGFT